MSRAKYRNAFLLGQDVRARFLLTALWLAAILLASFYVWRLIAG
jgi:hypothetical protein